MIQRALYTLTTAIVVGAVTFPASAQESSRVTGPAGTMQTAIAGGATLRAYITPVPEGGTASNYPPGTSIVGQDLRAITGNPFIAMFNVQIEDWDPVGVNSPLLKTWQVKINQSDLLGANAVPSEPGCDLTLPVVGCPGPGAAGNAACAAALEEGSGCVGTTCRQGFFNKTRPDWVFSNAEPGNSIVAADLTPGTGLRMGATVPPGFAATDGHLLYYGATLALAVPACASSTYTLDLEPPETFFQDDLEQILPILALTSGRITFPALGSCCFGIGTPGAGCTDGVLQPQCGDNEPSPFVWTAGGSCATSCVLGSCCYAIGGPTTSCTDNLREVDCGDFEPPPVIWTAGATCDQTCTLGACCYAVGTPGQGCTDDSIQSQCGDDEPGPVQFTPGGLCIDKCLPTEGSEHTFTYQGLIEKNGTPFDGSAEVIASLYDAETGGSVIGTFFFTTVQAVDGVFTAELDFGPSAAFDGSPRWLELAVRAPAGSGSFTQLLPRARLWPAPMAQHSNRATAATALDAPDGDPIDAVFVDNTGRVGVGTTSPVHPLQMASGAHVTAGGVWTNASGRDLKENLGNVDPRQVLAHLAALPIHAWNYKNESSDIRHMGPMAEDFQRTFALGGDDQSIGTIDADGVALAAIQGLHQLVQEKDCEIDALGSEISNLKSQIAELKALLDSLAEKRGGGQ